MSSSVNFSLGIATVVLIFGVVLPVCRGCAGKYFFNSTFFSFPIIFVFNLSNFLCSLFKFPFSKQQSCQSYLYGIFQADICTVKVHEIGYMCVVRLLHSQNVALGWFSEFHPFEYSVKFTICKLGWFPIDHIVRWKEFPIFHRITTGYCTSLAHRYSFVRTSNTGAPRVTIIITKKEMFWEFQWNTHLSSNMFFSIAHF